jgi:hypothetical protein
MEWDPHRVARALRTALEPSFVVLIAAIVGLTFWNVTLSRRVAALGHEPIEGGLSGPAAVRVGDVVPSLRLNALDGAERNISFDGSERYLLFVFSPLCPSCRRQLPGWADITKTAPSSKVIVRWLSVEDATITERHLSSLVPRELVLLIPFKFVRACRVAAVPQTLLVSANGEVEWAQTGELSREALASLRTAVGVARD